MKMVEHSTANVEADPKTLTSIDDLLVPFFEAIKPPARHRIGAEAEKLGVTTEEGAALAYEGSGGVLEVLEALVARHGWLPERETPAGPVIALRRGGSAVTLEPGGQLELSGAPMDNIHLIADEMAGHLAELREISNELGITWLGLGFHPFARQNELPWVPKQRYAVMKEYLPTRGAHALDMMRRTATVQANYDYESEEGAMRRLRLGLRLSPLVTAIFANSPFVEGVPFGGRSFRAQVWLHVDPDRQGLLPPILDGGTRFIHYVEWALDVPMFLFKRGGAVIRNTGQTFRSFMTDGFKGFFPLRKDWEMHLNTLFPEVRLKQTIEVRGADSVQRDFVCALPALWTGIFYDETALAEAEELSATWSFAELEELRPSIVREALRAEFRGVRLADLAQRLLAIAAAGLERRGRLNKRGQDERVHLEPIMRLAEHARCPADVLLDGLHGSVSEVRAAVIHRGRLV